MEKTIAAISTAQAPGGIGIVRISGSDARKTASRIFKPKGNKNIETVPGYTSVFGHAVTLEGEVIDTVLALVFIAPKSYTGEDVVELSCHGGMFLTERILREALRAGAAPASPGEFTKRAFLNGKIDLAEAEAVMELIKAKSADAAKAAAAGNDGILSKRINEIKADLLVTAAHLSAWADYPEDEVPEITDDDIQMSISSALERADRLLSNFETGKILREGIRTVIVGKPNVGKSTIMNMLTGYDRSIVTEYAGTTRDIVEETVLLGGIPLYIADTAGIHETDDPVESIGVNKAEKMLDQAQLVLSVFDASEKLSDEDRKIIDKIRNIPSVAIINKTDLGENIDKNELNNYFSAVAYISARSGEGIEKIENEVRKVMKAEKLNSEEGILYTERQRDVIVRFKEALEKAYEALVSKMTFDAVTVAVEESISILMELTGERVSESVVDEVFSKFCVGK